MRAGQLLWCLDYACPSVYWSIVQSDTHAKVFIITGRERDGDEHAPLYHYRMTWDTLRDTKAIPFLAYEIIRQYEAWTPPPDTVVEDSPDHPEDEE